MFINNEVVDSISKVKKIMNAIFIIGQIPFDKTKLVIESKKYKYKIVVNDDIVMSESLYLLNPTRIIFFKTSSGDFVNLYVQNIIHPILSIKNIDKVKFTKKELVKDALCYFVKLS